MSRPDPDPSKKKPALPEALNPEIGNGALWEKDEHFLNLRSVDPALAYDDLMLGQASRDYILNGWKDQLDRSLNGDIEKEGDLILPIDKQEIIKPASGENQSLAEETSEILPEDLILKEDPNKPGVSKKRITMQASEKPVFPEGKRIRKTVKKVHKKKKSKTKGSGSVSFHTDSESELSPYTKWLKSLRGSEYVHPYEDDYALDRIYSAQKEGISETFADLLAAQGYKDQAAEMYRLLMARFPEKSSFFAAKIEALNL